MTVTIFTPTFNRAYILPKLYRSLCAQTSNDFEWVIVDDGSTDNTEELVNEWKKNSDNGFDIIYEKKQNGGKHRAVNAGVKIARGELFFIVDSDDYLTDDAVEKLVGWYNKLDDSHKFAAVSGAKGYDATTCVGGMFDGDGYTDVKNTDREKYNLTGDKAEAYLTSVLREYPFPEFEGENFITEEVVWNAIAYDGYYVRWYKDIIYICDYLDDGLTKNGNAKFIKNPQGVLYWTKQQLKVFPKNTGKKLRAVNRYCEAVNGRKKVSEIAKDIGVTSFYCRLAMLAAKIKRGISRG